MAADGQVAAPVYSIELLGVRPMISYRIGDALVSIKAPKEYRAGDRRRRACRSPRRDLPPVRQG